jgi:hypothetical protein
MRASVTLAEMAIAAAVNPRFGCSNLSPFRFTRNRLRAIAVK